MIQNKSKIIGITGGIGTGKSTVTDIIKSRGYTVIDADKIARQVVEKHMPAYRKIVEVFGAEILQSNGDLDRKALGNIVFNNEDERLNLNNIVHSHIFEYMKSLIEKNIHICDIIFLDIPLLFEEYDKIKEYGIIFDEIWLVYTDRKTQIERIIKRDKISEEDAISRIKSQIDIEEKKHKASEILDNSGTIEELGGHLDKLFKRL